MTMIVGVDGSVGAQAGLEFDVDEAARRQSQLRVITVVEPPANGIAAVSGFVPPSPAILVKDVNSALQQHVDEIVTLREGGARLSIMWRHWKDTPGKCSAPRPAEPIYWWSAGAAKARWPKAC